MQGVRLERGHATMHVACGFRNSNRTSSPCEAKARAARHGTCWAGKEMVWQPSSVGPLPSGSHLVHKVNRLQPALSLKGTDTCLSLQAGLLFLQTHSLSDTQDGRSGSSEMLPLVTCCAVGTALGRMSTPLSGKIL